MKTQEKTGYITCKQAAVIVQVAVKKIRLWCRLRLFTGIKNVSNNPDKPAYRINEKKFRDWLESQEEPMHEMHLPDIYRKAG